MSAPESPRPALVPRLLRWYDRHARDLPWRGVDDPYAVWISEVMCQQTRVDTVVPYFERWLRRFPSVEALAGASEDEVFALWAGLGYYSRARNLQRAARAVVERHGGRLPPDAASLGALPGVGRYTAGAIASIAFGQREALVDGNVTRVLARLFDVDRDIRAGATQREIWALAEALVPPERPGDFNQALMELGATVCTPRAPRCPECPVAELCEGRSRAESLPVKRPKPAPRSEERFAFAIRSRDGRVLVGRNRSGTLLGGMWQYPMAPPSSRDAAEALRSMTGLRARRLVELEEVVHVFSHIRLRAIPVAVEVDDSPTGEPEIGGYERAAWMTPTELAAQARSKLVLKLGARFAEGIRVFGADRR